MEKWLNSSPSQGDIHGFESRWGHQTDCIRTLITLMMCASDSHSTSLLILRKCDAIRRELLENSNFFLYMLIVLYN